MDQPFEYAGNSNNLLDAIQQWTNNQASEQAFNKALASIDEI